MSSILLDPKQFCKQSLLDWQYVADHVNMFELQDGKCFFIKCEELLGTVIWLLSGASQFVTGAIVPIDGGFSSFSIYF